MRSQVKTKERVRQHGEVFTAEREVMAMMDLVKEDASNIDSTFFEPACGDGNFLAEILSRKMRSVFKVALSNDADCEYWATRAFSTIYGVDIMLDNVEEARNRLFDSFFALFINRYKHQPTSICQDSVRFILSQNIQCGDTLACKQSDGNPLTITKWAFASVPVHEALHLQRGAHQKGLLFACRCKTARRVPHSLDYPYSCKGNAAYLFS